jgi:hypothetical protein
MAIRTRQKPRGITVRYGKEIATMQDHECIALCGVQLGCHVSRRWEYLPQNKVLQK